MALRSSTRFPHLCFYIEFLWYAVRILYRITHPCSFLPPQQNSFNVEGKVFFAGEFDSRAMALSALISVYYNLYDVAAAELGESPLNLWC